MIFPIDLWSASLLLAINSLLLLFTSEVLSLRFDSVNILLSKKRLHIAAAFTSFLFLVTVALKLVAIILNL